MQLQYGVFGPISSPESDIEQIYEQYLIYNSVVLCWYCRSMCFFQSLWHRSGPNCVHRCGLPHGMDKKCHHEERWRLIIKFNYIYPIILFFFLLQCFEPLNINLEINKSCKIMQLRNYCAYWIQLLFDLLSLKFSPCLTLMWNDIYLKLDL